MAMGIPAMALRMGPSYAQSLSGPVAPHSRATSDRAAPMARTTAANTVGTMRLRANCMGGVGESASGVAAGDFAVPLADFDDPSPQEGHVVGRQRAERKHHVSRAALQNGLVAHLFAAGAFDGEDIGIGGAAFEGLEDEFGFGAGPVAWRADTVPDIGDRGAQRGVNALGLVVLHDLARGADDALTPRGVQGELEDQLDFDNKRGHAKVKRALQGSRGHGAVRGLDLVHGVFANFAAVGKDVVYFRQGLAAADNDIRRYPNGFGAGSEKQVLFIFDGQLRKCGHWRFGPLSL